MHQWGGVNRLSVSDLCNLIADSVAIKLAVSTKTIDSEVFTTGQDLLTYLLNWKQNLPTAQTQASIRVIGNYDKIRQIPQNLDASVSDGSHMMTFHLVSMINNVYFTFLVVSGETASAFLLTYRNGTWVTKTFTLS